MVLFNITRTFDQVSESWAISFGEPGTNDQIVRYVQSMLDQEKPRGGKLLTISGPASLPVAFVLAHAVNHLYGAVAVYDPKLQKHVVVVSHDPTYKVGDLI